MRSSEFINARAAINAAARASEIVIHIIGADVAPKRYSNAEAAPVIMELFRTGHSLSRSAQDPHTLTVYISFRRPAND